MNLKLKYIAAVIVVVVFVIFGGKAFFESTMEYSNFAHAKETGKRVPVKGRWVQEKGSYYDSKYNQFTFYMRDTTQMEVKVVLDGPKPNNFELASHVVATGRFENDYFHASQVLTKCPSKYEGVLEQKNKTSP
ncbi:MAG: cytochrome c maturation protein CcmE [Bacteroidota bacterium]